MQFCALNKDYLLESSSLHIVGFMSADTPVNAYVVQVVHVAKVQPTQSH